MAYLIRMPRAPWRRQPPIIQPVRWNNPLNKNLRALFLGHTAIDVVNNVRFLNKGAVTTRYSTAGKGLVGASGTVGWNAPENTAGSRSSALYDLIAPPMTLFLVGSSTINAAYGLSRSDGSGAPFYGAGLHYGSSSGAYVSVKTSGGSLVIGPSSFSVDTRLPCTIVVTIGIDTTTAYWNLLGGPPIYTRSGSTFSGSFSYTYNTASTCLNVGNGATTGMTVYLAGVVADELWSIEKVADFFDNPWQLFTTAPSRFILIPGGSGVGTTLVVQNAIHNHSTESLLLLQSNVLALAENQHNNNVDHLNLTQAHSLTISGASHPHTVESMALLQAHILNLNHVLHGHSTESPTLTLAGSLAVADAIHPHAVAIPGLIQSNTLVVQETVHSQSVDAVSLTQAYVLAPSDAAHSHTGESPALSMELNLTVLDAVHSTTAEAPGLTQAHVLALMDALHNHSVESVNMGQGYSLIVANSISTHHAELATLRVGFVLEIQDALYSQWVDGITLATHIILIVSDSLHSHLAGSASEIILPTGDRIFLVAYEDRLFLVSNEDRLFGV